MGYTLVQMTLADYDAWKPVFDEFGALRQQHGSMGGTVFRDSADGNKVTILLEWKDLEQARVFFASDEVRAGMQRAGVMGPPQQILLELADHTAS